MPLQNRVDPWGQFHAVPYRGAWMGNRGILHNEEKQIVAPWRHKNWVTCRLQFKDRKRKIFTPHSFSELFFLDEATAFSAAHRPCGECRRERYKEFKSAWCAANSEHIPSLNPPIVVIDRQLHGERAIQGGDKVTFWAKFQNIPTGTIIEYNKAAFLHWQDRLYRWSFTGYTPAKILPNTSELVQVLTPASIIRMFREGFRPQVHESAYG